MISPVSNFSLTKTPKNQKNQKTQKNQSKTSPSFYPLQNKQNQISYPINFYTGNINFTQYLNAPIDFDSTIEENYFQLPKTTLKSGETYQLPPDENQKQAARELYHGNSLLYAVSTGSGKTAVAHYIITKNLKDNKKSIYTTPTKALANDKFDEFCEIYGKENTGLLTGDKKINSSAPVVIMTTEIYDKQVTSGVLNSKNTGTAIFDEAHYISDEQRGNAWENSIIESANRNIQTLFLTATIRNGEEFRSWIESLNPSHTVKKVEVSPSERFVPQVYYSYFDGEFTPLIDGEINLDEEFSKKQNRGLETLFRLKENKDIDYKITQQDLETTLSDLKTKTKQKGFSPKNISLDELKVILEKSYDFLTKDEIESISQLLLPSKNKIIKSFHNPHQESDYPELVFQMKRNNMLPAIIYRLSKRNCEDTANDIAYSDIGNNLTTPEEKEEIEKIINRYIEEKKYLGVSIEKEKQKLINGIGIHHSSKAPDFKELVEELFRKKLLKVVVATTTLGVGIDMPAKSTVMTDMTYKSTNSYTQETEYKPISTNEFYQMIGRAGRRGQDSVGNVIIYNPFTYNKDKKNTSDRIDEEALIKKYLISKPDNLTSSFKPSVSGLAQYYIDNISDDGLLDLIKKSFKVHLSKNPDSQINSLQNKFKLTSRLLLSEGYTYSFNGETHINPKGKILALSKSSNPLLLSSILYDENLKGVSVEQLCQIAGYIAGSNEVKDQKETADFSKMLQLRAKTLKEILDSNNLEQNSDSDYQKARTIFKNKEKSILENIEKTNADFDGKAFSDDFSGYVAYCFATLNKERKDSISNFNKVILFSLGVDKESTKNIFKSKAGEGDVYKIIAQTASILKQMEFICDFALENEDDFPNSEYWQEVKTKAQEAIKLMNKPPIKEFNQEDTTAFEKVKKLPVNTCPICLEPMAAKYKAQKYATRMLYLSGQQAYDHIENGIQNGLLYPMAKDDKNPQEDVYNSTAGKALLEIQKATLQHPNLAVKDIIELLADKYSDETNMERMLVLGDMEDYVKKNVKNKALKDEIVFLLDQTIDEVAQTPIEFKNKKFKYKLKQIFDSTDFDFNLYDKLIKMTNNLPSSKNDLAAFFVRFKNESPNRIASTFANKKTATAMEITPEDSKNTGSYIKVCTPCKDEKGARGFFEWAKTIPDFRRNIESYIETILQNSSDNQENETYIQNLIQKLKN